MKTNLYHGVVIALSLGAVGVVRAESGSGSSTRADSPIAATGYVADGSFGGDWTDYRGPSKWSRFRGRHRSGVETRGPIPSRPAGPFYTVSDSSPRPVPAKPRWGDAAVVAGGRDVGHGVSATVGSGRRVAVATGREAGTVASQSAASQAPPGAESLPPGEVSGRFADPFGDDPARAGGTWEAGVYRGAACGGGVPHVAGFGGVAPRPALSPWYGGFNLLFLNFENAENVRLLYEDADPSMSRLWSADVDPSASAGFDVSVGRYLANGRYGLGLTYFNFDPGAESAIVAPGSAGDFQPAFPGWNNLTIDPSSGGSPAGVGNGGADSVYNYYDEAAAFRGRRNVDFQGLELNFSSFGVMGAQRAAACGGSGLLDRFRNLGGVLGLFGAGYQNCGPACDPGCGPAYGFGGAAGPLVRPCGGRVQVVASHGFRWFQFRDEFGFDANIDGTPGYHPSDLYYDVDTENNLFGYQFGGRLIYCLCNRVNLSIAGKFGLYGNRVTYRQRLGTHDVLATYTNFTSEVVDREGCETVLSTLGELDFGLGYRVCNAWTLRGGYRILGATGVATSVGSISQDFASVDPNSAVYPGSSVVLHGGYVGAEYNW